MPLLYLRGDADPRDINDYLAGLRAAGVARLQGRVIANSGEYLPVEAPESFCRALQEFRATLLDLGKSAEVLIVPHADHGFANTSSAGYNEQAATETWAATLAFLQKHLKLDAPTNPQ